MSSFIRSRIFISFILLSAVAWPVAQQAKAQGAQGTQGFQGQRGPQIHQGPWNETPKGDFWVEPLKEEPAGTHYKLFATPSRGPKTEASYLIYFPPGYEQAATRRYPVLYWLHEGNGNQLNGAPMVARIDKEILAGKIPPFIVVLVQGLPSVRYINAKDGKRPVEDVIVKDLIPHIDATYRTVASREGRAIEGMSMGGYRRPEAGVQVSGVVRNCLSAGAQRDRDEGRTAGGDGALRRRPGIIRHRRSADAGKAECRGDSWAHQHSPSCRRRGWACAAPQGVQRFARLAQDRPPVCDRAWGTPYVGRDLQPPSLRCSSILEDRLRESAMKLGGTRAASINTLTGNGN